MLPRLLLGPLPSAFQVASSSLCTLRSKTMSKKFASSFVDRVISAGRLVGYPASLLSLQHLFGEEMSYLASYLKRLLGSKHPVVDTAREVLLGSVEAVHIQGIMVLLVSKLVNLLPPRGVGVGDHAGILDRQRSLAELTERVQAAHMIHLSLIDLQGHWTAEERRDMDFGNKISILSGDLLLAKACVGLAGLQCPKVVEIISMAISDMMVGTANMYDEQGLPQNVCQSLDHTSPSTFLSSSLLSPIMGNDSKAGFHTRLHYSRSCSKSKLSNTPSYNGSKSAFSSKSSRNNAYLLNGSLLAHSCKAAAILTHHDEEIQNRLFSMATNFSLAREALRSSSSTRNECGSTPRDGSSGLDCESPVQSYVSAALDDLSYFPSCDTRQVIIDIVSSVTEGEAPS